ncbi:MAG: PLP-dependent aminotransferase family protein [Oscillospiraceae bacterium]|nr:PLP-dependent aminotransferase family protein [Oscillospiraceae bacterium]
MKYRIDKENGKPAYLQLYEQLKRDILNGIFAYGARLPSKRLLAAETGLSVIPVVRAYGLLCDEGYAEARERSGYFVVYREGELLVQGERVPTLHRRPHTVRGQFPFSVLAKTMRRVLLDRGEEILVKSPNHGCAELRTAIAGYLRQNAGIAVRPEQVIVGSGAEYLYSLIVQLLGKERVFALEQPSYEKIRQVYEANGVRCELLRMGKNGIRSAELERTNATVLHVTPFNSWPSGVTADASKRSEYLRWAERRNGYLIEDNYDAELTLSRKNDDTLFALSDGGRVLYLNTFSQTIAPSLRVGYLVLPERLLQTFERKLGFYSCTVPVFEQYVLAELLRTGDFVRHINRVRRAKRKSTEKNS